jgi:hypothetical protein
MTIPVYDREIEDGLEESIASQTSFAFQTEITKNGQGRYIGGELTEAKASMVDTLDLFYIEDILVSTVTNLNFDHFLPEEVWKAKDTPKNKPFNLEHDSSDIIGHIIKSVPVDENMTTIPEDIAIDDLPAKFHLLNESVIYKFAGDKERREFIADTIQEIRDGEWSVSMECLMYNFDYLVTNPDGESSVVARNAETSWMTKHLPHYEDKKTKKRGTGVYTDASTGDEYKIGRVPRNFTFSGKGLVRKPANPESVIIKGAEKSSPKKENPKMDEQLKVALERIAELEKDAKAAKDKEKEEKEEKDKAAKKKMADYDDDAEAKKKEIAGLKAQVEAATATIEKLKTDLSTANLAIATVNAEKSLASRKNLLASAGAPEDKVAEILEKYKALDDAVFASVIEFASAGWKVASTVVQTPLEVAASVLDKAKPAAPAALAVSIDPQANLEALSAAVESWAVTNFSRPCSSIK